MTLPPPWTTRLTSVTTRSPATTTRYYDPVSQEHQEGGVELPSWTYQELPQHRGVTLDFGQPTFDAVRRDRNTRAIQSEIRDVLAELDEASLDVSNRSSNLSVLEEYKAKHGGIPAPVEHVELTQEQEDDAYQRFGTYSHTARTISTEATPPSSVTDTSGRRQSGQSGRRGGAKGRTYTPSFSPEFVQDVKKGLLGPFLKDFKQKAAEAAERGDELKEEDYAHDLAQEALGRVESFGIGDAAKTPTFNPEAGAVALREALLETQKRLAINKRIQEDPTVNTRVDVAPITKEEIEEQENAALDVWGLHPSQHQAEQFDEYAEQYNQDASIREAAAPFVQEYYDNQPGLIRRAAELVPVAGTVAYGIGPGGRSIGQTLARAALFDLPSVLTLGRFPAARRSGGSLLGTAAEIGLDVYAFNPRDLVKVVGRSGSDFTRAIASEVGGVPRTISGVNPFSDTYLGSSIATSGGTNKIDLLDLRKFGLDETPGPGGKLSESDRVSQEAKEKFAARNTEVGAGSTKVEIVTDSGDILEFEAYTTLPGSHTGPDLSWLTASRPDGDPIGSSSAQPFVVDVQKAVEEAIATRTEVRQLSDQLGEARAGLSEQLDDLRPLQEEQARLNQEYVESGAWKTGEARPVVEGLNEKTTEAMTAVGDVARAQIQLEDAALLGEYARMNVGEEGAMFFGTGAHENFLRSSALGLPGGPGDLATAGGTGTFGLRPGFNPTLTRVVAERGPAGVLIGPRAVGEDHGTVIGDPHVRDRYKLTRELGIL